MSASRSRRATAKAVNYAKEQQFSDEDLFEDSEPEDMKKRGRKPRASTGTVTVEETVGAGGNEVTESRIVYTEKGYDMALPPIRERFPFLPEYSEDGSPKIELIVGRRPVDEKDDGAPDEDEEEEPSPRKTRGDIKTSSPGKKKDEGVVEYEYLVKYRGRSYLHLEWKSGADLESMNKSAKGIYRRWLKKLAKGDEEDLENPEFDPLYIVPGKILDEADQEITVELTDKELLRWEKQREKELEDEDDSDDEEGDVKSSDANGSAPQSTGEDTNEDEPQTATTGMY